MLRLRRILILLATVSTHSPWSAAAQSAPAAEPATSQNDAVLDFTSAPDTPAPSPAAPAPASPPAYAPAPAAPIRPHTEGIPPLRGVPFTRAFTYRPNALNFSVLGFVIGNLRLTYERLLRPKHGVYAEGILAPDVLNRFDFVGYGGSMGYRFHWRGPATGGFVGGGVTLIRHSGKISVYDFDDKDTYDYRGSLFSVGVGPHIGKRWLWERTGINLTIRFGVGVVIGKTFPKQNVPRKATDGLTRFPVGTEGEVSVGYTF